MSDGLLDPDLRRSIARGFLREAAGWPLETQQARVKEIANAMHTYLKDHVISREEFGATTDGLLITGQLLWEIVSYLIPVRIDEDDEEGA